MKPTLLVAVCVGLLAVPARADSKEAPAKAEPSVKTPAAFEVFKSLVGDWESSGEMKATVSYELVAGGSALVERMAPGTPHSMVTVYHPDDQRILMTHYCATGNQPRMAGQGDAKSFTFKMIDITNLANPKAAHMASLTITFVDKDHIIQEWGYVQDGKTEVSKFEFERKKSS